MFFTSMDGESQSTLEFEFGIVGEQLELSDDETLLSQVAMQAPKLELQVLQDAKFAAWKDDKANEFQDFLKDLLRELRPRNDDHLARVNILTRLASALEQMYSFRGATLSPFGSFESNLYTRWADLDLSLELPDRDMLLQPVGKRVKAKVLSFLLRTLIRKGEAHNVQFIPYARVPLITFEDSKHNISCDISVNNDAAILKSRLLRWICEVDTRCRDLIFLVKFWAKAHGINDPKVGTLNSFALCLLVIFHLQTRSPPILPPLSAVLNEDIATPLKGYKNLAEEASNDCWTKIQSFVNGKFGAQNKSSVAELFVTFIHQFSAVRELWSQGLAVCTFSGTWGDRSSTCGKWRRKVYMMAIEDPFDRSENCARSVQYHTFDLIMKAFTSTAEAISCPIIDAGLPSLLESLFLWPVNMQASGLQAWLSNIHSENGKHNHGSNVQAVKQYQHNYQNVREASLDVFLENTLEVQLRNRLQLQSSVPSVMKKKKKKKREKKKSFEGIVDAGSTTNRSDLESREQKSKTMARKANKVRATRNHVVTREGISPGVMDHRIVAEDVPSLDTDSRNALSSAVREDSKANTAEHKPMTTEAHEQIEGARIPRQKFWNGPQKGGWSKNHKQRGLLDPVVAGDVPSLDTDSRYAFSSAAREDSKANTPEDKPITTEEHKQIRGARIPRRKLWNGPQKGSSFKDPKQRGVYIGTSYFANSKEAQHLGDPWPALQRSCNDSVGLGSTETSSLTQAHTHPVQTESYVSATKNVDRQGSQFKKGVPKPENGIIRRNVGAAVPSVVNYANHRARQGEAMSQTRRMPPSQESPVWMPRNMGNKFSKFSSTSKGHTSTM